MVEVKKFESQLEGAEREALLRQTVAQQEAATHEEVKSLEQRIRKANAREAARLERERKAKEEVELRKRAAHTKDKTFAEGQKKKEKFRRERTYYESIVEKNRAFNPYATDVNDTLLATGRAEQIRRSDNLSKAKLRVTNTQVERARAVLETEEERLAAAVGRRDAVDKYREAHHAEKKIAQYQREVEAQEQAVLGASQRFGDVSGKLDHDTKSFSRTQTLRRRQQRQREQSSRK